MPNRVLITGAGKGLGFYLSEEYLGKGDVVYALNLYTTPGETDLLKRFPENYFPVQCDVADEESVKKAAEKISGMTGDIDILINNAAVQAEKPFTETNEFDVRIVIDTFMVNAVGPLLVTKYFYQLVVAGKGKTFVNISSEAGSISQCWRDREYGYCMSKAALNMQSVILQNKLKSSGVKVLAIHPGWMRTDMGGKDADSDPRAAAQELVATISKNNKPGGPIYIDHSGNPMQW